MINFTILHHFRDEYIKCCYGVPNPETLASLLSPKVYLAHFIKGGVDCIEGREPVVNHYKKKWFTGCRNVTLTKISNSAQEPEYGSIISFIVEATYEQCFSCPEEKRWIALRGTCNTQLKVERIFHEQHSYMRQICSIVSRPTATFLIQPIPRPKTPQNLYHLGHHFIAALFRTDVEIDLATLLHDQVSLKLDIPKNSLLPNGKFTVNTKEGLLLFYEEKWPTNLNSHVEHVQYKSSSQAETISLVAELAFKTTVGGKLKSVKELCKVTIQEREQKIIAINANVTLIQ